MGEIDGFGATTATLMLLAGCGGTSTIAIGESDDFGDGTLTVTAVEEMSAADISMLTGLDEVDGQTPYFVRYEVDFGGGEDSTMPAVNWKGRSSAGTMTPVNLYGIGEFECSGRGEVENGVATGCQLFFAEPDATVESVNYGGSGPWAINVD